MKNGAREAIESLVGRYHGFHDHIHKSFDVCPMPDCVGGRVALAALAWQPIETAPQNEGRLLAVVDGCVRFVYWGKTSHVPLYGWNLADQGVEDCELCEPTHWMHIPEPPK